MDLIKSSLLKATALMIGVLTLGVLAGLVMDDARTGYLEDEIRNTELQTETFVVSQQYLQNSSQNYCQVMEARIPEISQQNAQIGRDLQAFSSKSIGSKEDYRYLKKKYYVNQLRLYLMVKDYKSRCNTASNLVLFFFDSNMDSKRQGAVLTEYRRNLNNQTYVFSYNLDSKDSEILEMLETDYSIQDGPVTVINGEVYREYVPLKQLKQIMVSSNDSSS